jgi:hypothetical protein
MGWYGIGTGGVAGQQEGQGQCVEQRRPAGAGPALLGQGQAGAKTKTQCDIFMA